MKPSLDYEYELDKYTLLSDLKELEFISKFILYDRFHLSKKKLRKKLKKLIQQVEENKTEDYLENIEE
jgi:hypothetical protein